MSEPTNKRDPRISAAADLARSYGFPNEGRVNVYQCEREPKHAIITIDREPGVTPFTVQCPHCEALGTPGDGFYRHPAMRSKLYRVPQDLRPTHEFYRPDSLDDVNPNVSDHVLKGGLLLREIALQTREPDHG